MTSLRVLICGGGCGGPALAFWLARAGHRVTIVEYFPALRADGAQIDVHGEGLQLARRMGIFDAIRAKAVEEDGFAFVDTAGKIHAIFGQGHAGKQAQTDANHYEIMRGDLVRILYDATQKDVKYIFGKTVTSFDQDDQSVTVRFSDGETDTYDLLVGADGQGSRIRKAILPPGTDPFRHIGIHLAFWRVPTIATDTNLAKGCRLPGGRMVLTRTHSLEESQAAFMLRDSSKELRDIYKGSAEQQKEFWASKFKDAGWEAPRLLEGMKSSSYFFSQEVAQVRTNTWYKGRVVLVADAAHCPSPMTGMGTSSAFVGAYVLAGEISENSDNLQQAFENYDKTLRPWVNEIQHLPTWPFHIMLPSTQFRINLVHLVARIISFLRIPSLLGLLPGRQKKTWTFPDYPLLYRSGVEK